MVIRTIPVLLLFVLSAQQNTASALIRAKDVATLCIAPKSSSAYLLCLTHLRATVEAHDVLAQKWRQRRLFCISKTVPIDDIAKGYARFVLQAKGDTSGPAVSWVLAYLVVRFSCPAR